MQLIKIMLSQAGTNLGYPEVVARGLPVTQIVTRLVIHRAEFQHLYTPSIQVITLLPERHGPGDSTMIAAVIIKMTDSVSKNRGASNTRSSIRFNLARYFPQNLSSGFTIIGA